MTTPLYTLDAVATLRALPAAHALTLRQVFMQCLESPLPAPLPARRESLLMAGTWVLCLHPHGARTMLLLILPATLSLPQIEARLLAFHQDDLGFRVPDTVLERLLTGVPAVRAWRELRAMSLERLAAACRITPAGLRAIEAGERPSTRRETTRIAEILGLPQQAL